MAYRPAAVTADMHRRLGMARSRLILAEAAERTGVELAPGHYERKAALAAEIDALEAELGMQMALPVQA